eukprot:308411_1
MGNTKSVFNSCNPLDIERIQTAQIDKNITTSKQFQHDKLLLLGTETSNTSRILRQIEYQHIISTTMNMTKYIISIRKYCVSSILKLYTKSQSLYEFNPINYAKFNVDNIDLNIIKQLQTALHKFNNNSWIQNQSNLIQISKCINILWHLDCIQSCWELLYCSNKNIKHFMHKIDIIMNTNNYTPTFNDIMYIPYSNISEISLTFKHNYGQSQMNIVTMNGSKYLNSKKWLHSFDDTKAIIFVVSLNDFDEICNTFKHTNNKMNALKYSLNVFQQIVNDKKFNNIPVILILDKFDLFCNKLNNNLSISTVFNEYIDNNDKHKNIGQSLRFIKRQFLNKVNNRSKERGVYIHTTYMYGNNVDTICQIFKDVQHIKLTKNLNNGGLL